MTSVLPSSPILFRGWGWAVSGPQDIFAFPKKNSLPTVQNACMEASELGTRGIIGVNAFRTRRRKSDAWHVARIFFKDSLSGDAVLPHPTSSLTSLVSRPRLMSLVSRPPTHVSRLPPPDSCLSSPDSLLQSAVVRREKKGRTAPRWHGQKTTWRGDVDVFLKIKIWRLSSPAVLYCTVLSKIIFHPNTWRWNLNCWKKITVIIIIYCITIQFSDSENSFSLDAFWFTIYYISMRYTEFSWTAIQNSRLVSYLNII